MRIASKYLLMQEKPGHSSSIFKAASYNRGEGGVMHINLNKNSYAQKIKLW